MDSDRLATDLDADGFAIVSSILDRPTITDLQGLFTDAAQFRSTIVMERHGYGRGVYRYFGYPLPPIVQSLRESLYAALVPVANQWSERLGSTVRYPAALAAMLGVCSEAGQQRPTALLLKYGSGDFNALHQDVYGEVAFPLQATFLLSEPGVDFSGGEFVLYESRPRRQSVARVVPLGLGDCVVFPNRYRPNANGGRTTFRHGVSLVRSGERMTLGIILHDAL